MQTINNQAYPPLFNVAPRASIAVNATCGSNGHEEYCRLGDAFAKKSKGYSPAAQCGICNLHSSDPDKNHSIDVILDNSNSWWQSPTLLQGKDNEYVTIVIDLKQVSFFLLFLFGFILFCIFFWETDIFKLPFMAKLLKF